MDGQFRAEGAAGSVHFRNAGGWNGDGTPPGDFEIGGRGTPFIFSLDDFRIYNRFLSETEVAQLYEYESTPVEEVPFVSITPSEINMVVGGSTTLVANLSVNSDTAFYQWFKDGAPLIGENTSDLSLSNLTVSDSGSYTVNVIVNQRTELSQPTILTVTDPDTDGDGLVLSQENQIGTNPNKSDTDDDGINDGTEVNTTLTDPRNPDSDGDGVNDGVEIASGSDPRNPNEIPIPSGRMTIAKLGAGLEISIHTSEGHRYQLQRSRGLIEWEDDGEVIQGTGSEVKVQREKFESLRFWRVLGTQ